MDAFDLLTFPAADRTPAGFAPPPTPGSVLATVDRAALRSAVPGATMTLAVPGGRTYTYILQRKVVHGPDSQSWVGVLEGETDDFQFVLTVGPDASFGNFATRDGTFQIDTVANQTWLVDMRASGLQRFVPTETDAIRPPPRSARKSSAPPVAELTPTPQTTIDVLVLYSPGLVTRLGSASAVTTRINQLVTIANTHYINSEIAVTLRLLQATQINGVADNTNNVTELYAITDGTGAYAGVAALRDAIGADMVTVIRPFTYPSQAGCGVAWIGGYQLSDIALDADYGYSVVSDGNSGGFFCYAATYAHELGHNMGSFHDRVTEGAHSDHGAYPYSYGYGVSGSFITVMAYGSSYGINSEPLKFSNPDLLCMGVPCGVPASNPTQSADNARSINNTRAGVASWRSAVVRPLARSGEPQVRTLQAAGGFPVTDWYELSTSANRSYEVQVVNVSATTNVAAAGSVARFNAVGTSQVQDSACLDAGCSTRTLRWIASADAVERLRVHNGASAMPSGATYTAQLRETTLYCSRWSESGGQASVLAVQRAQSEQAGTCSATAFFYDEAGVQLATQAFSFTANKVNVQSLSAIGGLAGNRGSLAIAHTCGTGGLKGIVNALEPSTGFSFGTPCSERGQ